MKLFSSKNLKFIMLFMCLALFGCSTARPPLKTAKNVDLEHFMGSWYIIAAIPVFIEKEAYNGIETYSLRSDGTIDTVYTFNKGSFDGPEKRYNPRGFVVDDGDNSTWKMQFIWPFKAEYLITYVSADYEQTLISRNKRDYFWMMARTPEISDEDYQKLIEMIKEQGYDLSKIRKFPQE
ncbi:MAG: lipocalin family protein [Candidatus Omnitrophica bacterium]|nr:lipocalin family protein [Candidatus Omnitrophota bacterium]